MLSHFGLLALYFVGPLIIRLTVGRHDDFVRHHSTEALNGQITFALVWNIFGIGALALSSATANHAWFLLLVGNAFAFAWIIACSIIGAIRASRGDWWRYPGSIRFVRGTRPNVR